MATTLQEFVDSVMTMADIRNMDEFNPVALYIQHPTSSAEFLVLAAVRPPTSLLVPRAGIWVNCDPNSPTYRTTFRAVDFDEQGNAIWEAVVTYDDLWIEPQEYQLPAGAPGRTGPKGDEGPRGAPGDRGPPGDAGPSGDKGDKGDRGEQGIQGIQGIQGLRGDNGTDGKDGVNGEKGERGDKGDQGERGDKGEQGEKGLAGDPGTRGLQGDRGEVGPQGEKGDIGNLELVGQPGLVLFENPNMPNGYEMDQIAQQLYSVESAFDLARLTSGARFDFSSVFSSWRRYSHGNTDAQPFNVAELSSWEYDPNADTIISTVNSVSHLGFVSPARYDSYNMVVEASSSDADDDCIGVVLAFAVDNAGREHTLTAMRTSRRASGQIGNNTWAIYYNHQRSDAKLIAAGPNVPDAPGSGWLGKKVRFHINRIDGRFFAYTTEAQDVLPVADEDNPYGIKLDTLIEFSLDDDPVLEVFSGPRQIGLCCFSQRLTTFSSFGLRNQTFQYYDLRDETLYEYDGETGVSTPAGVSIEESIGAGRFVYHPDQDRLYYTTQTSMVRIKTNHYDNTLGDSRMAIQRDHGFLVGDVLAVDASGTVVKAKANSLDTLDAVMIVERVLSDRLAIAKCSGIVNNVPQVFVPGVTYRLSMDQAGKLTRSRQTVDVPCFKALTANSGVFIPRLMSDVQLTGLNTQLSGWKYRAGLELTDTTNYAAKAFNDSAWPLGEAPFGNLTQATAAGSAAKGYNARFADTVKTTVPLDKKLWMRRVLTLGITPPGPITLMSYCDNSFKLYINGVQVTEATFAGSGGQTISVTNHGLVAGDNVIAVEFEDDALVSPTDQSYFDFALDF